ncbi:MAG: hypothetical protein ACK5PP_01590 [Acidimicrobiales bacterium]
MAVLLQTFRTRVRPGKLEEAQAEAKRAKELYEGRGASSVRAFWSIDAGDHSGDVTIVVEYPDAAAWSANVDSDDDEMHRVRSFLANGEGPLEVLGTSLLREVNL